MSQGLPEPRLWNPSSGPFHSLLPGLPDSSIAYLVHPHCTRSGPSEIYAKLKTLHGLNA